MFSSLSRRQDGAVQRGLQPGARVLVAHEVNRHPGPDQHHDEDQQPKDHHGAVFVPGEPAPAPAEALL